MIMNQKYSILDKEYLLKTASFQKGIKNVVMILFSVLAVAGLSSCSEDDEPQLTQTVAPVLSDLATDTIAHSSVNDNYTFNWSSARFHLDNEIGGASIGSFEDQGINYNVQVDLLGGDFSSGASLGQVVSSNHLNVTYADVTSVLTDKLGLDKDTEKADLIFRVVARYSSTDSLSLVSNTIQVSWKKAEAEPIVGKTPQFFICDNAGWGSLALYAWNETGNMLPWPGVTPSGTKMANGKTYYVFDMPSDYINRDGLNFIVNNNGGGSQMDLMQGYTFASDVFITVNADGTYTIDEAPSPKLYLRSATGWSDYYLYVWGSNGDVKDSWPGVHYAETTNIGGETWYVFNMPKEYSETIGGNWIVTDNAGNQIDLMKDYTFDGDIFVTVNADGTYTESVGPIYVKDGFTVYANIDDTGWDGVAMYNWGGPGELAGGWPGAVAEGPIMLNGKKWYYHSFQTTEDINVILNNNGGGSQCADVSGHQDVFVTVKNDLTFTLQHNLFE